MEPTSRFTSARGMRLVASPPILLMLALMLALMLTGCSSDGGSPDPTAPTACAAGTAPDATGACAPTACAAGQRRDPDPGGTCKALGWQSCPAGFIADASGHGCREVLPTATCAPGTMPVLGQATCQPVGPASCAAGFERDPGGWGCRAVLPAASCAGATKETLGNASCAPVGDCSAAFPPAGASVFVNGAFTAGQLDATHVRTLGAALTVAAANAVIAVDAGTYTETLAPGKSVRVVGRCAAQVTLASAGADVVGVHATGPIDVTVEGMTIAGHLGAVTVDGAASVTLRDVVMAANRAGVSASGTGTRATIERSVVRGSLAVAPSRGIGIESRAGAELTLRDSVVSDNVESGILVAGTVSHVGVERSVILSTRSTAIGDSGIGLMVRDGATSDVSASAFAHNHEASVVSSAKGSKAVLTDVVIADTLSSKVAGWGRGVIVDTGSLELERVTITGSNDVGIDVEHRGDLKAHGAVVRDTKPGADGANGIGVAVLTGATATFGASAFVGNISSGANAVGPMARLTLEGSLVTGTHADASGGGGYGVELELGAAITLHGSAVVDNTLVGAYAIDPSTQLTLDGTIITGTRAGKAGRTGRGIAIEKGATAAVTRSALVGNRDVGISTRGAGSALTIDQSVVHGTRPQDADGTHGRALEADEDSKMTVSQSSFLGNHGVALIAASRSVVDVRDSWIADTLADSSPGGPGRAVTVQNDATMTMLGVVVQRSAQLAMAALGNASLTVRSSLVEDTAASSDGFGHGVIAYQGSLLVVDDVTVTGSAGAALVFDAARGNVKSARITGNAVGIHVQDGSSLAEVAVVPEDPAENAVNVSSDTTFDGNGSRVGSGELPLPAPLL